MSRVASIVLLLIGTFLCVTWIVSPASSEPQALRWPTGEPGAGVLPDDVTVEPIRPMTPAPAPADRAVPHRNPFSFRSRPSRPVQREALDPSTPMAPARPAPSLPQLVAIIRDRAADGGAYQAVLSTNRIDVTIVRSGATFGEFSIADVRSDVVILRHTATGDLFRLPLR